MIEEELYSDSDHSSKYTSEDEYEVDRGLQGRFAHTYPLKSPSVTHKDDLSNKDVAAEEKPAVTVQRLESEMSSQDKPKAEGD